MTLVYKIKALFISSLFLILSDTSSSYGYGMSLAEEATQEIFQSLTNLCKTESGNWKLEIVKIPDRDDHFDCSTLMKLEFDLINEQSDARDGGKSTLSCVTKGLSLQDQITFARNLENLGALELPIEEYFNCPGKNKKISECLIESDMWCNLASSLFVGVGELLLKKMNIKSCENKTTKSNCFDELFAGIVKNITSNIDALVNLPSLLWGGVKWLFSSEEASRDQLHLAEKSSDQNIQDSIDNPGNSIVDSIHNFFSSLGNFMSGSIKDNFGCAEWSSSRITLPYGEKPKCLNPVVSWKCATCSQALNMTCGIIGYAGGEIVSAFLTGGTIGLAKVLATATKGTRLGQKAVKSKAGRGMAKLSGKTVGVIKFPFSKGMGVIQVGGRWMMKTGGKLTRLSKGAKKNILNTLSGTAKVLTFVPRLYLKGLEKSFIAGYHAADGMTYLALARGLRETGTLPVEAVYMSSTGHQSEKLTQLQSRYTRAQEKYKKTLLEYEESIKKAGSIHPEKLSKVTSKQLQRLRKLEQISINLSEKMIREARAIKKIKEAKEKLSKAKKTHNKDELSPLSKYSQGIKLHNKKPPQASIQQRGRQQPLKVSKNHAPSTLSSFKGSPKANFAASSSPAPQVGGIFHTKLKGLQEKGQKVWVYLKNRKVLGVIARLNGPYVRIKLPGRGFTTVHFKDILKVTVPARLLNINAEDRTFYNPSGEFKRAFSSGQSDEHSQALIPDLNEEGQSQNQNKKGQRGAKNEKRDSGGHEGHEDGQGVKNNKEQDSKKDGDPKTDNNSDETATSDDVLGGQEKESSDSGPSSSPLSGPSSLSKGGVPLIPPQPPMIPPPGMYFSRGYD